MTFHLKASKNSFIAFLRRNICFSDTSRIYANTVQLCPSLVDTPHIEACREVLQSATAFDLLWLVIQF